MFVSVVVLLFWIMSVVFATLMIIPQVCLDLTEKCHPLVVKRVIFYLVLEGDKVIMCPREVCVESFYIYGCIIEDMKLRIQFIEFESGPLKWLMWYFLNNANISAWNHR